MKLAKERYKRSKEDFDSLLFALSHHPDSLHFSRQGDKELFWAYEKETISLALALEAKQKEIDDLYASFSSFGQHLIRRSFFLGEVCGSNEIENVHSSRRDAFLRLERLGHGEKEAEALVDMHLALEHELPFPISSPLGISCLYQTYLQWALPKGSKVDGELFRASSVAIVDGVKEVHAGLCPESKIKEAIEEMLSLREKNAPLYIQLLLQHLLFEHIHPFYDGNGRMGRFLLSASLWEKSKSPCAYLFSSAFYAERKSYYRAFTYMEDPKEEGCLNAALLCLEEVLWKRMSEACEELKAKKDALLSFADQGSKGEREIRRVLREGAAFSEFGISVKEMQMATGLSPREIAYLLKAGKEEGWAKIQERIGRRLYWRHDEGA